MPHTGDTNGSTSISSTMANNTIAPVTSSNPKIEPISGSGGTAKIIHPDDDISLVSSSRTCPISFQRSSNGFSRAPCC